MKKTSSSVSAGIGHETTSSRRRLVHTMGSSVSNILNAELRPETLTFKVYACAKHVQDSTRCETMIWFDDSEAVRGLIPLTMKSPRTPRKQVDIRMFGQYTAPSTSKRKADTQKESFDSGIGDLEDNGKSHLQSFALNVLILGFRFRIAHDFAVHEEAAVWLH